MTPEASRKTLLLLVATGGVLRRGGAMDDEPYGFGRTAYLDVCRDEVTACGFDDDCRACYNWRTQNRFEVFECEERYYDAGTDVCSRSASYVCCPDEFMTDNDCAGNTAIMEYALCYTSYLSTESGEAECTTPSCSPKAANNEQGNEDDGFAEAQDEFLHSCLAELTACGASAECLECYGAPSKAQGFQVAAYDTCAQEYHAGYADACESILPTICCPDEKFGKDCSGNTA